MLNTSYIDATALAADFDVDLSVMEAFINRFAPACVGSDTFAARADVLLFVHIPKTAGMSVGRSLRGAFDTFRGVDWKEKAKSFRDETRAAVYQQSCGQGRQVIMGHYGWNELQLWRNHEMPLKCGTILRDPVARTVSNYNYNSSPAHPPHKTFSNRFPTLEDFVTALPFDVQVTQAVGLVCSFENLLTKLTQHYTFLGVTEHLATSLQHLGKSHGLPRLREYRENVGGKSQATNIPTALRDHILDRSHNDEKLHRLLTRLYGGPAPAKDETN